MRRKEREVTDWETIQDLLKHCHIVRIAMFDETYPYVVPVNFGYEWIEQQLILYIHGAAHGKKVRCIEKNAHVSVEMDRKHRLIEAGTNAPKYSYAYQSFIGYGQAEFINDVHEKMHALDLLMSHETGKGLTGYDPLPKQTLKNTGVIKIILDDFSCKENLHPDEK